MPQSSHPISHSRPQASDDSDSSGDNDQIIVSIAPDQQHRHSQNGASKTRFIEAEDSLKTFPDGTTSHSSSNGELTNRREESDKTTTRSESNTPSSPSSSSTSTTSLKHIALPLDENSLTHRQLDPQTEEKLRLHFEKHLLSRDNKDSSFAYSATDGTNVYCFSPSKTLHRGYWTCVSLGMSSTAMRIPSDRVPDVQYERAEVICYLPDSWRFPATLDGNDSECAWPIELLRSLVRYVNATDAWVGADKIIPNMLSDPTGQPFCPNTKLSHAILLAPINESEDFGCVRVSSTVVNMYVVVPITTSEANWAQEQGPEKSIYYVVGSRLTDKDKDDVFIDYIIDPRRPCTVDDLNCRELFDSTLTPDDDDRVNGYEEFDDLESSDNSNDITSSIENQSGKTENCSDSRCSSDMPSMESGERSDPSSDPDRQTKRARLATNS